MDRAVVSGEIADEAFDDLRGQPSALKESVNVEEIPRMLAIQRRDELAAIQLRLGRWSV